MIIKAVKEKTILDEIMEKVEREELQKWYERNRYSLRSMPDCEGNSSLVFHPLRKILNDTDAYMLGRSLDVFHIYRQNKWKIEKAIRDRDMDYFMGIKLNPQELLNLIVYNKITSNPKYRKDRCPDRFKDILLL